MFSNWMARSQDCVVAHEAIAALVTASGKTRTPALRASRTRPNRTLSGVLCDKKHNTHNCCTGREYVCVNVPIYIYISNLYIFLTLPVSACAFSHLYKLLGVACQPSCQPHHPCRVLPKAAATYSQSPNKPLKLKGTYQETTPLQGMYFVSTVKDPLLAIRILVVWKKCVLC